MQSVFGRCHCRCRYWTDRVFILRIAIEGKRRKRKNEVLFYYVQKKMYPLYHIPAVFYTQEQSLIIYVLPPKFNLLLCLLSDINILWNWIHCCIVMSKSLRYALHVSVASVFQVGGVSLQYELVTGNWLTSSNKHHFWCYVSLWGVHFSTGICTFVTYTAHILCSLWPL